MKNKLFLVITVVLAVILSLTIVMVGCKTTTVGTETTAAAAETTAAAAETTTATTEKWVPYYKTKDFKAFVELKPDAVDKPADEMKVKPVDRFPEETVKIAVLGGQTNPFFNAIYTGVEAARLELAKYNTVVDWIIPGATFGSGDYGEAINTLVTKGYNGIVTMIFNEGMIPFVNDAVKQNVVIGAMLVNSKASNNALFFIGRDLYKDGVIAAEELAKILGGKGKVAIITGFYSVEGHELRRNGFIDTMTQKYPDIKIVGTAETKDIADNVFNAATDFMTANPDLVAIYNTAGGAVGSVEAIKQAGKTGQIKVVCFNSPELLDYIGRGEVAASIAQNAFAEGHDPTIRIFNYLMDGVLPPARNMWTDAFVITPETLKDFIASGELS